MRLNTECQKTDYQDKVWPIFLVAFHFTRLPQKINCKNIFSCTVLHVASVDLWSSVHIQLGGQQKFPALWWPQFKEAEIWRGGQVCVCVCVCLCMCVLLAWRAMLQGVWAASEGPVCPQSLTICALLVVIKVSNLEVSWGLAKRGQKMSLRCSSHWAAVTIFTYLYTLIVFALLPWHWGRQSLRGGKKRESENMVTHSQIKYSSKVEIGGQIHPWAGSRRLTKSRKPN